MNETKGTVITTSVRIAEQLYNEIQEICAENGISLNGALLMLLRLGIKAYGGKFIVSSEE